MHSDRPVVRVAFSDAAPEFPVAKWQSSWIWTSEATDGVHDYVCFRRVFRLEHMPTQALLRLAAEREATLWVNGELISYGPPISDPRFKRYETHDVTEHLVTGENCIAVRVYHGQTSRVKLTAHGDARGLLCQLECDGEVSLASDTRWRARLSRAYIRPVTTMGDTFWPEIFDANQDTPGWTGVDFDEHDWPFAKRVIAETHSLWSASQPQARFFPWVNLIPCETRPLKREKLLPSAILSVGEVLMQREATPHDTAVRMSLEPIRPLERTRVEHVESLLTGTGFAAIHNSSLDEPYESFDGIWNVTIVLDFGRLVNARFGMQMEAEGGSVDIGYAYELEDGRVVPYVSCRTAMADFYRMRSGEQRWESADWRHFRYVQLTFRNLVSPLTLSSVWVETVGNCFEARGKFACDDEQITNLFDVVRRTVELNVVDRAMDNPSRERRQYLGDCSTIVTAITAHFGDCAVLRRYFANAAEGQHATGQYRYSYPGHDDDGASLFDHALSLPLRLWEHYQLFADRSLVVRMWPGIDHLVRFIESCLDEDDRMVLPPYSIFFDWGHMDRRGAFLPLQAMSAEAVRCAGELARIVGTDDRGMRAVAERLRARVRDWFDPGRGVFVDSLVDGEKQAHFSEHANSLVAYWGLAPDEMIQTALDRWSENPSSFGQASPAWHYLPSAFLRAGRPELTVRWMHRKSRRLGLRGLDTWPETWHANAERATGRWRCRNSRAIAQAAGLGVSTTLLEDFCGIYPGTPGFATVYLRPQLGPLMSIAGTRPGPDGDYSLELRKVDSGWVMRVSLPSPRRVILDAVFAPQVREAKLEGRILSATETRSQDDGLCGGRFEWDSTGESELFFPCP